MLHAAFCESVLDWAQSLPLILTHQAGANAEPVVWKYKRLSEAEVWHAVSREELDVRKRSTAQGTRVPPKRKEESWICQHPTGTNTEAQQKHFHACARSSARVSAWTEGAKKKKAPLQISKQVYFFCLAFKNFSKIFIFHFFWKQHI